MTRQTFDDVRSPPNDLDMRAIRERMRLTRPAPTKRFGVIVAAVSGWEQRLRQSSFTAGVLQTVVAWNPETVMDVISEASRAYEGR